MSGGSKDRTENCQAFYPLVVKNICKTVVGSSKIMFLNGLEGTEAEHIISLFLFLGEKQQ
jgi:hypothetical protein